MKGKEILGNILGFVTLLMVILSLYGAFKIAPTEKIMGDVQRIFYFHVAIATVSFLAFFIVCVASVLFLMKKDLLWDRLASCTAEIGILFLSLVLLTGMLWAKPVWNVWWAWDPRLVTTLLMWFIYVAYFMVRASVSDVGKQARFSAVIGIVGFLNVPIVYLSTSWWRSIHPLLREQKGGLDPLMLKVMLLSLFTFTLVFAWVLWYRFGIAQLENEVAEIKAVMEKGA
jgi:heme exporter protein C